MYDADYFLRGRATGKSLYEDYRWLPDLTIPMVRTIISHLGIGYSDTVLDFGCARGYTVKAFRKMGYCAYGEDVSEWAIANCDPEVRGFVFLLGDGTYYVESVDWVVAKDVLEHVPKVNTAVDDLLSTTRKGVFAVVPLSSIDGDQYVVPEYEKDVTHVHRLTLATWVEMFLRPGWSVEASYRVPGVKDNYAKWERGNGFITARRLTC